MIQGTRSSNRPRTSHSKHGPVLQADPARLTLHDLRSPQEGLEVPDAPRGRCVNGIILEGALTRTAREETVSSTLAGKERFMSRRIDHTVAS